MITRLKLSTIEQGLPKYRSMLAGNDAYIPNSFESIATATGTGSSGVITFSSIPSTYQHLQVRIQFIDTNGGLNSVSMTFNNDTASNYVVHRIFGNGTSVTASATTAGSSLQAAIGTGTTYLGVSIIDIHDYASTTKNKVTRTFTGREDNSGTTNSTVMLNSGLWLSTNAINRIDVTVGANFTTDSKIALYGIKA